MNVERSLSESVFNCFHVGTALPRDLVEEFSEIADRVGHRLEGLRVRDVMIDQVVTIAPDTPLADIARELLKRRVHRVLVSERERLLGMSSGLDFSLRRTRCVPSTVSAQGSLPQSVVPSSIDKDFGSRPLSPLSCSLRS